jgi:predicted Rossmann-fold nucleotide-binding protein
MARLPYDPLRSQLYSTEELMVGYDARHPDTTLDATIAKYYALAGAYSPETGEALTQRLHDFGIDRALQAFLLSDSKAHPRKVVGIMGGHDLPRSDSNYVQVFRLAYDLARLDYCVTTGGGLGIMEAANAGAFLAAYDESVAMECLAELQKIPTYNGSEADYINSAIRVREHYPKGLPNLAVPTWTYATEPISQFATHIAKYFSNSIREDGLLAIAKYGVVFASGGAGTIQEIFQDAAHNSYKSFGYQAPIIFLGDFFAQPPSIIDVVSALATRKGFGDLVAHLATPKQVTAFLSSHPPRKQIPLDAAPQTGWAKYHLAAL